jgi:2-dehydropantoate 2-reductase
MLPLLKAKGGKVSLGMVIMLHLPAGLLGFVAQQALSKKSIGRTIMDSLEESGHSTYEITSAYPRDVFADSKMLGVALPLLAALEPSFC